MENFINCIQSSSTHILSFINCLEWLVHFKKSKRKIQIIDCTCQIMPVRFAEVVAPGDIVSYFDMLTVFCWISACCVKTDTQMGSESPEEQYSRFFNYFCSLFLAQFHLFWGSIPSKLGFELSERAASAFISAGAIVWRNTVNGMVRYERLLTGYEYMIRKSSCWRFWQHDVWYFLVCDPRSWCFVSSFLCLIFSVARAPALPVSFQELARMKPGFVFIIDRTLYFWRGDPCPVL